MPFQQIFDVENLLALVTFSLGWAIYSFAVDGTALSSHGLSRRMNSQREIWMWTMLKRDLRMIDTAIMTGLQQGTGFFASACIFAIGGCFALIGAADHIASVVTDLPLEGNFDRALLETKLLGLVTIFIFAFFKFGWAYRLFNYCTILIGAVPMAREAEADQDAAERAVRRAIRMNQIAARHFNSGLRAIFFGMAYLGWFLGPKVLMLTTTIVILILARRQFFSEANDCLAPDSEELR
ncbi:MULTISPECIES: DUF599 domain-containing protein [unclassified Aureimonas]|uniref:DUF599 domain-containing protein n=1 Tax=unclassified Aureimonas TaxID=2615206 RepID=UPI0007863244|nr:MULTISPECIES: DUF599 family protein [unclassified Aureimonas]